MKVWVHFGTACIFKGGTLLFRLLFATSGGRLTNFISMASDAFPIFREATTKGKQIHRLSLAVF